MHKTKILFVSHSAHLFGAERCLLSIVKNLDKNRFDTVVILPEEGPLKLKLDESGIRNHVLPIEWWVKNENRFLHAQDDLSLTFDRFLRITKNEQPDIIHTNTSVIWFGALAAALLGIKHVWHIHEIFSGNPTLNPIVPLPLIYRAIDFLSEKVVIVSNSAKEELSGFFIKSKLQVIYNGIERSEFITDRSFRSEINAGENQVISVTVTSIYKHKGIDNLLVAARKVAEQNGNVLFVIAGVGSSAAVSSLTKSIHDMKLERCVRYLGQREDIPRILAGSDIFVLPSLKDAFPLVVLEAMAQGKPVIATDCGGPSEMIIEGKTGFIVPVNDPDSLAVRILALAKDEKSIGAMGKASLKRFRENFLLQNYIENFEHLYQDLALKPKPPLTTKDASLLNSLITMYAEYFKDLRKISKHELEISNCKQQLIECTSSREQLIKEKAEIEKAHEHLSFENNHKLGERDTLISGLSKEIEILKVNATELSHKLATEVSTRNEQKQHIERLESQLKDKGLQLTASEQEIELLRKQAAEDKLHYEKRIEEQDETITRKITSIEQLESQLHEKDVQLTTREQDIEQLRKQAIDEKLRFEKQIEERDEAISEKDSLIEQMELRLQGKRVRLATKKQKLLQIEEEVARESKLLEDDLRLKNESLRKQTDELQAKSSELKTKENELAQLRDEREAERQIYEYQLREKKQRIEDLLNSKSWKITAPLRAIFDFLHGK